MESFTKFDEETIPRTFSKKIKLDLKFYTLFFHCMLRGGLSKYIKTKYRPVACASYKAFLKNIKESETSLPAALSA